MSIFSRFPRVRAALVIAGAFGAVWALGVVAFGALIGGTFQGIGLADALLRTAKAFSVSFVMGSAMGLVFAAAAATIGRRAELRGRLSRFFAIGALGGLVPFSLFMLEATMRGRVPERWFSVAILCALTSGAVGAALGRLTTRAALSEKSESPLVDDDEEPLAFLAPTSPAFETSARKTHAPAELE